MYLFPDCPHWGSVSEAQIALDTGIATVRLLNDYEANGYGVLNLDPTKEELLTLYNPEQHEDNLTKIVYGVGTGVGFALMTRPDEHSKFHHYPSEVGSIALPLHNKTDRALHKWLTDVKKINAITVSTI